MGKLISVLFISCNKYPSCDCKDCRIPTCWSNLNESISQKWYSLSQFNGLLHSVHISESCYVGERETRGVTMQKYLNSAAFALFVWRLLLRFCSCFLLGRVKTHWLLYKKNNLKVTTENVLAPLKLTSSFP